MDAMLASDMAWARYLSIRLRRAIQAVMLLYLLLFVWPSYYYNLYLYPTDAIPPEIFGAVPEGFYYFGLIPGVLIMFAARFVVVPLAFGLVALVWVGWESLPRSERIVSALTSLITIVAIPLTSPLFEGFVRWMAVD